MDTPRAKERFIRQRIQILKDFGVLVTPEIQEHIESLYPCEIAIENYTRKIILQKLGN